MPVDIDEICGAGIQLQERGVRPHLRARLELRDRETN